MEDLSNEQIVHVKKGKLQYIQFKRLLAYPNIVHCFTLKPLDFGSNITYFTKKEEIANNITLLGENFKLDTKNIYRPKQTHTNRVEKVEEGGEGIYNPKYDNVDGLVTDKENKILILGFADCTPLFFYDPVKDVIANTHSDWKGTLQTIAVKTVEKMQEEYNCQAKDIICCIGPHIRKCHFEVDEEVKNLFYEKFKTFDNIEEIIHFDTTNNKYHIDTTQLNKQMLKRIGLQEENIIDSNICTVCHSNICHSFRAEKEQSGRSISMITKI